MIRINGKQGSVVFAEKILEFGWAPCMNPECSDVWHYIIMTTMGQIEVTRAMLVEVMVDAGHLKESDEAPKEETREVTQSRELLRKTGRII